MQPELSQNEIKQLNDWAGFLSFKKNFITWALNRCTAKIIFVETGNQAGKTADIAYDYVLRTIGRHPIEQKNMRPNVPIRTMRFASETLPNDPEGQGEVKNTIYPALKKWIPPSLIKKDITARRSAMTIRDVQGGPDIIWEFVSYNQSEQSQAGVQRFSVYEDEEPPKSFHEEQLPRLMAAASCGHGGDLVLGLTPVEHLTWTFEDLYDRRRITYNSPAIIDYMQKMHGEKLETLEITDSGADIAIIRAATDDNPTLSKQAIDDMMAMYDDPDVIEIRRYGIFHQISGRILKDFDVNIHRISRDKYFEDGVPNTYIHARGVDFHEKTPWACGWIALSPKNEAFVWQEYNPSPEKNVSLEISRQIAERSGDYRFWLDLIDPLAEKKQANTGLSVVDDLNRYFKEFRRDGKGTGAAWQTWDTKSSRGRDIVKERLKNSRLCGTPFNNRIVKDGKESYLPTLWVLDNCPLTVHAMKNWSWDEWANRDSSLTKEDKNKPQDKYSHFPIMIECVFKHPGFSVHRFRDSVLPSRRSGYENMCRPQARP